MHGFCNSANI